MAITLNAKIKDFYNKSSPIWEKVWGEHMHHGYYGVDGKLNERNYDAQIKLIQEVLKWSSPKNPQKILDVGCGVGGSSVYLANYFNASVTGISLSDYQVKRARERVISFGLEKKVDFFVDDALNMKFNANEFDYVWSLESAEHFPDKIKFLNEAYRVLKPGGEIIVVTWCKRESPPELTASEQKDLETLCDSHCISPLISINDLKNHASNSGFIEIETADWTTAVAPFWKAVIMSALSPKNWIGLLMSGVPTVKALVGVYMMDKGYKEGFIKFGLMKAKKPL